MSADLFGTPTPIAQQWTFWNRRLKLCLHHTACKLWQHNTAGMEWRRKSSITLYDAHWLIPESHPHSTTAHILKYTIETVSVAHRLQAMASQQGWNDVEIQVSHYLMSVDLFGTPTPLSQLCVHFEIYGWNSIWIIPLTSYAITLGMEWRRKFSIPLSHVRWFIRDSHPHSTAVNILK